MKTNKDSVVNCNYAGENRFTLLKLVSKIEIQIMLILKIYIPVSPPVCNVDICFKQISHFL